MFLLLLSAEILVAQPAGYYDSADGKVGQALRSALHDIIKGHTSMSYGDLLDHYPQTDAKPDGTVWDMYSDIPGTTPAYQYYFDDNCGNYAEEGDCYNREHVWAQSWSNKDATNKTDIFHVFPTDGYVNGRRSNYAFGEVKNANWISTNGSKLGSCDVPGFSGTVFEPIDEYKGDIARAIFYVSTRYYGEDSGWDSSDMTNKSNIKEWAVDMLLQWHRNDPVSQKEIDRNNKIYDIQHNRNPFIDNPDFAEMIWDETWNVDETALTQMSIYPNPANKAIAVTGNNMKTIHIYNTLGQKMLTVDAIDSAEISVDVSNLNNGLYLIQLITTEGHLFTEQVIINKQ